MSDIEIKTRDGLCPSHGWVFSDFPVYDAAACERHWQSMLARFDATLKR